jgi:hypothetical protein
MWRAYSSGKEHVTQSAEWKEDFPKRLSLTAAQAEGSESAAPAAVIEV